MKATEIIDVARMLQRDATGPVRRNGDVPVFVARRRRMRDEIAAHPFDRVADMGRDLRWREFELVDHHADCVGRKRGRGARHRAQDGQCEESRTHRLFLFQRLSDMFGVLLVTLEYLETGGQEVLQLGIAGVGDQDGFERGVDRLVVGDLIVGVGLVEGCAAQLLQLGFLGVRLFG